jgi:[ribosomal protein S5]-alanine N-acetyltransferase
MQFQSLPVLAHPQFMLRPLAREDLGRWSQYLNLPSVYEHTSWNHPTESDLEHYLGNESKNEPSGLLRLAIASKSEDLLVGTIGFHTVSSVNRSAELAYDLHPSAWRQGVIQHAGRTLIEWAHSHAGVVRVQALVLETNVRSIATLQRLAFVREGLLNSYKFVRGKPGNFYMYAHVSTPR